MDKVFARGIELFGHVGVFEAEKRDGQRFLVDVEVEADLAEAGRTDALEQTIDYAALRDLAARRMEGLRCDLIETYAERLAADVFEAFEAVRSVRLRVSKPDVSVGGPADSVGVEIYRRRHG